MGATVRAQPDRVFDMPQETSRPGRPAATADLDVVLVGRVGGPFGVKGWTRVASYTNPPENLLGYAPWQLRRGTTGEAAWERAEVEAQRHGSGVIARFAGVRDRDAAVKLRGSGIGVAASVLPAPEQGEYYWRDLIGAEVANRAGVRLGEVRRLFATPAHDVLVVADADGERLIPFVGEWVVAVIPESGRVVVDWEADWG